jgi:radical SAM superfamily enzyme YgiQ (UPF0313 family)
LLTEKTRKTIQQRLADEVGRLSKEAPVRVCLAYPSPYSAGMSSLGFQRIYRAIMEADGLMCERAFLADDPKLGETVVTYESLTPIGNFPIVAVSVAYELELAGLIQLFDNAKIPVLAEDRDSDRGRGFPFVLAGGPLTFSNPLPLAPFVDAMIIGEAEGITADVIRTIADAPSKAAALAALAKMDHVYVPVHHGQELPSVAKVDDALLPAWAPIRTPHTELSNMFLLETERGCSRRCTYCVMRRSTNGGMRLVPMETILGLIPDDAKKVGLVGAAVSDHPKIVPIVKTLAESGRSVGLSSLRPDRLSDEFVGALKLAGYRTLTTAMDGPSERMRESLDRHAKVKHLISAAERARAHRMTTLKLYLMVGLPGETYEDIDECVKFTTELSRIIPVALGIAPFCAKRNTPLDGAAFAGIQLVDDHLDRLRRGLKGKADMRSTSAKWAWVEYILAQGSHAEGKAVITAVRNGGSFSAYKKAFAELPDERPRRSLRVVDVPNLAPKRSLPVVAAAEPS